MGWQIINALSALISLAFLVLKATADWIGRTTVPEDASQLQQKAVQVFNWVAEQPWYFFYGAPALLFILFGWQLLQRLGEHRPNVDFGVVEMTAAPVGCAMILPIRVRTWQGTPCRVTMDLYHLDDARIRPSFVLVSEQEAVRSSRRVGRVTLDDTFKRFELFHYDARRETLHLMTEAGDYTFPMSFYKMLVTVSGAGPAKPTLFILQPIEDGIRLGDGTEDGVREVVFTRPDTSAAPARPIEIVEPDGKSAITKVLVDFFKTGVRERNRLNRPVANFDSVAERQRLVDWSDNAVERMDNEFVNASERSRFETLDRYEPEPLGAVETISEQQLHIQTMWTEKLKRLRAIIDRLGGEF